MRIQVRFKPTNPRLKVALKGSNQRLPLTFDGFHGVTIVQDAEPYEGVLEITPKAEKQVISTKWKLLPGDITVNPIPKEWGCVTYDQNKRITVT